MIKKIGFMILFLFGSSHINLYSASFEEYVSRLETHPQYQQIMERAFQFKQQAISEKALPDLQIIIGLDNLPVRDFSFNRYLPSSKTFGFKQEIPNISLRRAKSKKQLALSKRQILIADYLKQRLKALLIKEIATLHKIKQQEILLKKQSALYDALEKNIQSQLESGAGVYARFSEIDFEHAEIKQHLNDLKTEKTHSEQELIWLIGEVPDLEIQNIKFLDWNGNINEIYPVLITREEIRVSEKDLEIAHHAYKPNYGIKMLYKQRESGRHFDGGDWISIQASISIPLWYQQSQKPKLSAAKSQKKSIEFAHEDMKRKWIKNLKSLQTERDIAYQNIQLFKQKKSAMNRLIDSVSREYESGKGSQTLVLNAEINLINIMMELVRQETRYITLRTELNSHIKGENNYVY